MDILPNNTNDSSNVDPLIPIPLSLLLPILWGYKKGADLRDRCVPGDDIIAIIEANVPPDVAAKHYVIQKPKAGSNGELATLWHRDEWRNCGARQEEIKKNSEKFYGGMEKVLDELAPKFPMLNRSMLSQLAGDLIHKKDWATLKAFGVNTEGME